MRPLLVACLFALAACRSSDVAPLAPPVSEGVQTPDVPVTRDAEPEGGIVTVVYPLVFQPGD